VKESSFSKSLFNNFRYEFTHFTWLKTVKNLKSTSAVTLLVFIRVHSVLRLSPTDSLVGPENVNRFPLWDVTSTEKYKWT